MSDSDAATAAKKALNATAKEWTPGGGMSAAAAEYSPPGAAAAAPAGAPAAATAPAATAPAAAAMPAGAGSGDQKRSVMDLQQQQYFHHQQMQQGPHGGPPGPGSGYGGPYNNMHPDQYHAYQAQMAAQQQYMMMQQQQGGYPPQGGQFQGYYDPNQQGGGAPGAYAQGGQGQGAYQNRPAKGKKSFKQQQSMQQQQQMSQQRMAYEHSQQAHAQAQQQQSGVGGQQQGGNQENQPAAAAQAEPVAVFPDAVDEDVPVPKEPTMAQRLALKAAEQESNKKAALLAAQQQKAVAAPAAAPAAKKKTADPVVAVTEKLAGVSVKEAAPMTAAKAVAAAAPAAKKTAAEAAAKPAAPKAETKPAAAPKAEVAVAFEPVVEPAPEPVMESSWRSKVTAPKAPAAAPETNNGQLQRGMAVPGGDADTKPAAAPAAADVESGDASGWRRKDKDVPLIERMDGTARYSKAQMMQFYLRVRDRDPPCPASMLSIKDTNMLLRLASHEPRIPANRRLIDGGDNRFTRDPNFKPRVPKSLSMDTMDERDAKFLKLNAMTVFNKMTLENFDKLFQQFLALKFLDPEKFLEEEGAALDAGEDAAIGAGEGDDGVTYERDMIAWLVDQLVLKAQDEPVFAEMYAEFCKRVSVEWTFDMADDVVVTPAKKFKLLLLKRCEVDFQQDRVAVFAQIQAGDAPQDLKDERAFIVRKAFYSHMQFIGEIYRQKLLKASIMYRCIDELIVSRDEEKLMCLGKLLTTVGLNLEHEKKEQSHRNLQRYFEEIHCLASDKDLSSRVRFMFMDLIDLRDKGWARVHRDGKAMKLSDMKKLNAQEASSSATKGGSGDARGKGSGARGPGGGLTAKIPMQRSSSQGAGGGGGTNAPDDWNTASSKKGAPPRGLLPSSSLSNLSSAGSRSPVSSASSTASKGWGSDSKERKETKPKKDAAPAAAAAAAATPKAEGVVKDLPGKDGKLDKETTRRVKSVLDEFYGINDANEVRECLIEMVHPNAMAEVLKAFLINVIEQKDANRANFVEMLPSLHFEEPLLLTKDQATSGLRLFLQGLDDIMIDVPLAGANSAAAVACLVLNGIVPLDVMCVDEFFSSWRAAEYVAQVLKHLVDQAEKREEGSGQSVAEKAIKGSKLSMADIGAAMAPKESREDCYKGLQAKYQLSFSLL